MAKAKKILRAPLEYIVDWDDQIVIGGPFRPDQGEEFEAAVKRYLASDPWVEKELQVLSIDEHGVMEIHDFDEDFLGELEDAAWGLQGEDDDEEM